MTTRILTALVLAGIVGAPLSTAALFIPARRPRTSAGAWPMLRRLGKALFGTVILAVLVGGLMLAFGEPVRLTRVAVAALAAASLLWLPLTRRWNTRSHLAWAASTFLFVTYLAFILWWTFASHLGAASTAGGLLLWVLEAIAAMLACAYLWELCDALGTEHWRRRITPSTPARRPDRPPPFVSLHVPAHNEPPGMVIQTLASLLHLDYPAYEIVAIDDNTGDEAMWRPVAQWCRDHGVKFAHLQDWPGYKSGALNYALQHLTDPRAELIGVVDSDYQIDPGFLGRCASLFADPRVGFIQAPQDYREWEHDPYFRRLYYSYKYFFVVSQPSRNERNGAIFAGTMGLIRRRALEQVGGWDEWCITEDAELSLRLLQAGWAGLHVDQAWGKGIMPLTFESLKSQRYRWCFGGIQIFRMHWRSLLPGRRTRRNRLTLGQRWTYFTGAIQWYGDLLGLAFFLFLLAGAVNLSSGGGQLFRKLTPFLVAVVPILVGLGLLRAIALLRRGTGASWRDALGAFFIWQSTGLAVTRASVYGLFSRTAVFMRTPKTGAGGGWRDALKANWAETTLAFLGVLAMAAGLLRFNTLSGPLLTGLLLVPTLGLAAAPVNSLSAQRAALPAPLLQRRRTEALRERQTVARSTAAAGGVVATTAAAAVVLGLFLAPGRQVSPPHLVGPGRQNGPAAPAGGTGQAPGHRHRHGGTPSPAGQRQSPSVTPSPVSSPAATPSASPTTSRSPSNTPSTSPSPSVPGSARAGATRSTSPPAPAP